MPRPNIPKYLHSHLASENSVTPKNNPKAGRVRCVELGLLLCPTWQREQHLSDPLGPIHVLKCWELPALLSSGSVPSTSRARERKSRQEFAAFPLGLSAAVPLRLSEPDWDSELCRGELLIPLRSCGEVIEQRREARGRGTEPLTSVLPLPSSFSQVGSGGTGKFQGQGSVAAPTASLSSCPRPSCLAPSFPGWTIIKYQIIACF